MIYAIPLKDFNLSYFLFYLLAKLKLKPFYQ